MRQRIAIMIGLLVPAMLLAAGPSTPVKRAVEARLVGHTLTLSTPIYLYAGITPVTTISPTRGLFYAGLGEADRDPQQLAIRIQSAKDRAREREDITSAATGLRRPSDTPILATMTHTGAGRVIRITKLHWESGVSVLRVEARDDLNMETGFSVAWHGDWPTDPALADQVAALITQHLGRLE